MVKGSALIKKLLPIGLVIGGLYFLSQSKRVNIFRTKEIPDITVQPVKNIPIIFDKLTPIPTLEPDEKTLFRRYGQLYTKTSDKVDTTYKHPEYAKMFYGSGSDPRARADFQRWLEKNRTISDVDRYIPIFNEDND